MSPLPHLTTSLSQGHVFVKPTKRIHDGPDVQFFLQSLAYRDITTFILQLNRSLVPRKRQSDGAIAQFQIDQNEVVSPQMKQIWQLITKLEGFIADAPPDTGPRRFGNVSFRKWYNIVDGEIHSLLETMLPASYHTAVIELKAYFLGSFGSPQRLDYGTGHELSFIAFLASLWKIGYFSNADFAPDNSSGTNPSRIHEEFNAERNIVLNVFQAYLSLIRKLIVTYNLEPAGSHGVWGLDDNSFLPYLFGSAQFCPAIPESDTSEPIPTPTSGSLPSAPDPSIVTKQNLVAKEAKSNLYFSAIDFIYRVKRGPFWEHSPMLFDISGIKDGWGKINKGLIKMYDAEVLGKFPVVQHFPFGSLLRWEQDPDANVPPNTAHAVSQPLRDPAVTGSVTPMMRPPPSVGDRTTVPWGPSPSTRAPLPPSGFVNGVTQAPWARSANHRMPQPPGQRSAIGMNLQSMKQAGQVPPTIVPAAKPNEAEATSGSAGITSHEKNTTSTTTIEPD